MNTILVVRPTSKVYENMSSFKKLNVLSDKSREELCLSNVSQNRQSFSDRICDDLCEEILQYLSLEDKLKLEGVSKQFQSTVLKKQFELSMKDYKSFGNRNDQANKNIYIKNKLIDLKSLEVLLKKCPNITSIKLSGVYRRYDYNPVFLLIIKYCNNLRQIDFLKIKINRKIFEEFQRKFGLKMKFIYHLKDANNYNLFPNIEKLILESLSLSQYYYSNFQEVIPRLKLNKLKNLELTIDTGEEDMLKTCVDTFPTLTNFHLEVVSENVNAIYDSLEFISNLKHLIHFRFKGSVENNKLFCDSIKRMANKFQKLRSIEYCLFLEENSDIRQLISSVEAFPALKRLCFIFYENQDMCSFEAFKGLSNITHLTLYCDFMTFKETTLKDIYIYLPNLQYLVIDNSFELNGEEVTQMANILSRLSKLKSLKLRFNLILISEPNKKAIEVRILQKCQKLRTLKIC